MFIPAPAVESQHCWPLTDAATHVLCTRVGYDALVDEVIDLRFGVSVGRGEVRALEAKLSAVEAARFALESQPKPNPWPWVLGGAVGGAALTLAVLFVSR